ncbi:tetratricopeptide repeat protein [bacterium]|nr:tetratricopeptide repeat protein [bacterium]
MNEREIVEQLEKRLQGNPKSLLFARLADSYIADKKLNEAVEICQEGIRYNPGYITGHFILAKAYALKKDYEKAEACLKKVLSFDREYLSAHKVLGDLMLKMGFGNKAGQHYREILAVDPMDLKTLRTLESLGEPETLESDLDSAGETDGEPLDEVLEEKPAEKWVEPIREVFAVPEEEALWGEAPQPEETPDRTEKPERAELERQAAEPAAGRDDSRPSAEPDWIETLGETSVQEETVGEEAGGQTADAEKEPAISSFPDFFGIVDEEQPAPGQRQTDSDSADQLASRLVEIDETGDLDAGGVESPAGESAEGWFQSDSGKKADLSSQETASSVSRGSKPDLESVPHPGPHAGSESPDTGNAERKTPSGDQPPPTPPVRKEKQAEATPPPAEPPYETLQPDILDTLNQQPEPSLSAARGKAAQPDRKAEQKDEKPDKKPAEKPAAPPRPAAPEAGMEKPSARPTIVTPTLGEIYAAQGQFQKALQIFETLLEQNPGEIRYQNKIQELKKKLQQP